MSASCPRCGFSEPGPVECPRCGVVLAKLNRPPRPAPAAPAPEPETGPRFGWFDATLAVALVASVAMIVWRAKAPPAKELPAKATRSQEPALPVRPAPPRPSRVAPPLVRSSSRERPATSLPPPPAFAIAAPRPELPNEDSRLLATLTRVVQTRSEVEDEQIRQAEDLYERDPGLASVRSVLEDLLELAAQQAHARGQPLDAIRQRVRAAELWPESAVLWMRLIQYHEQRQAWRDAEAAARRGLSASPGEAALHRSLAMALMQQGRDEEAADVLRRLLARQDDSAARQLLARLETQLGSVAGLARQASTHFDVRFEGQADDALGKALLQMLEDKHTLLSRTLGFEPDAKVQVILLPRETFRSATTAPGWAGGYFSHFDGRIRIGTRNMSVGFVPLDLERTLTHELTHAFVAARTRGVAPGDVNEGLAQYLSGKRLGYRLAASRAVARDGRMKVDDYYDSALSFVEYLLDRYNQVAMNELLESMGKTGSVDQAFRRAYHMTYAETREEWLKQLQ